MNETIEHITKVYNWRPTISVVEDLAKAEYAKLERLDQAQYPQQRDLVHAKCIEAELELLAALYAAMTSAKS